MIRILRRTLYILQTCFLLVNRSHFEKRHRPLVILTPLYLLKLSSSVITPIMLLYHNRPLFPSVILHVNYFLIQNSNMLWLTRYMFYMWVVLGSRFIFLQVNVLLVVAGFIPSKLIRTDRLIGLRFALFSRGIFRYLGLNTNETTEYLPPPTVISLFINWTLRIFFSIVTLRRKFIRSNHLVYILDSIKLPTTKNVLLINAETRMIGAPYSGETCMTASLMIYSIY